MFLLLKCPNVRNIVPKFQITKGSKIEWCKYNMDSNPEFKPLNIDQIQF